MLDVRPAASRGHTQLPWLDSRHGFSFADYHDPAAMGYRALRVINEDIIAPGQGFGEHGHRDMEILTYILSGTLTHQDSLGHRATIRPGELQIMSAGTGIRHSEWNASTDTPVHLLQIWIMPAQHRLRPDYRQKAFDLAADHLVMVANPGGDNGALKIYQNAWVYVGRPRKGRAVGHELARGRHAWLQVASGRVDVNGASLDPGDGAAISGDSNLDVQALTDAEFLLFDLG